MQMKSSWLLCVVNFIDVIYIIIYLDLFIKESILITAACWHIYRYESINYYIKYLFAIYFEHILIEAELDTSWEMSRPTLYSDT